MNTMDDEVTHDTMMINVGLGSNELSVS